MTPIDQQIAIAESQGYQHVRSIYDITGMLVGWREDADPKICKLPNYTECLNAMHEVEKTLTTTQRIQFADILYNSVGKYLLNWSGCYYPGEQPTIDLDAIFQTLHAPASQRAEAYLRTINKWKD